MLLYVLGNRRCIYVSANVRVGSCASHSDPCADSAGCCISVRCRFANGWDAKRYQAGTREKVGKYGFCQLWRYGVSYLGELGLCIADRSEFSVKGLDTSALAP